MKLSRVKTITEFLELNQIDRRQFLLGAGGLIAGLSTLSLVGCGGSGGNGFGAPEQTTATGTIQFPAGFKAKLKGLTVTNGHGSVAASSSMAFTVPTTPIAPSLAYVQDSTGAVIFVGFVDPTSKSNVLGAQSTAIALIYFSLDAYSIPPANNGAVLSLIAADPNTAILASAISKRMLSSTYALDQTDSVITAALQTAYKSITGATIANRRPASRSVAPPPPSDPAQLLINGGTQSGFNVNVDPTGASPSYTGQNTFRRYATMYAYETSTTDAMGNKTTLTNAQMVGTPLDVDSTQRLNIVTSLKGLLTASAPLTPITTAPLALALPTGATKATFDIIVLGSSGSVVEPAFFSETAYSGQVAAWKSQVTRLNLRTAIGDVFFGLILNMIGVTSVAAIPLNIDAAVASLEALGEAAWQSAIQEAAAGTNIGAPINYAAKIILKGATFPGSSSAWAQDVYQAYEALIAGANATSAAVVSEATFTTSLALGFRVILGALSGASIVLGVGDLAAVIKDMMNSVQGDVWSASLGIPPIHISPSSVNITPGSSTPQEFTISLPPGATGTYKWTWTLTGGVTAQITDEEGHQGTVLSEISAKSVYLLTTSKDVDQMTLTVEGYFVESGGALSSIGTTAASILPGVNANYVTRLWTGKISENNIQDPTATDQYATCLGFFTFPTTPGATNYKVETPTQNIFNLSASDIAGLPVANSQLGFPFFEQSANGTSPPWSGFVQIGSGLLGFWFSWDVFPYPNTEYTSPDGINVTAAGTYEVFWRYYTIKGQNSLNPNTIVPVSDQVIADTLSYMQAIMQRQMTSARVPTVTVT